MNLYIPFIVTFCVQVIVHLVISTIKQLRHVTRVCLVTSKLTEDLGNVLHVQVECLPGPGEPPNVTVSEQTCSMTLCLECVCFLSLSKT